MHKRIQWLDSMKGFMIIFVVLCHSLILNRNLGLQGHFDAITLYIINTFIMPCFFAISGFLYHRVHSWKQYFLLWYKKGVGLAIPYFFISIALYYYMHVKGSLVSILYQPIFLMWFLYALFFIFIIVGTLDLLHISKGMQLILYLIALVAQTKLTWWNGPNFDMNPIACTFGYIIFFYVGYLIKYYWSSFRLLLDNKLTAFILFIIFLISLFIQIKYTGVFPYNTDQVTLSDTLTKLWSIPVFFSLFASFSYVHVNWLNIIGRNTLVVYLVHYFAVHTIFVWIMINTRIQSPILQTGFRFVTGIIGSLVMIWLVKKINIIKIVFYPRYYLDKLVFMNGK